MIHDVLLMVVIGWPPSTIKFGRRPSLYNLEKW